MIWFFHKLKKKGHGRVGGLDSTEEDLSRVMQRLKLKCFIDLHNIIGENSGSLIANVSSIVLSALYVLSFVGRRSVKVLRYHATPV